MGRLGVVAQQCGAGHRPRKAMAAEGVRLRPAADDADAAFIVEQMVASALEFAPPDQPFGIAETVRRPETALRAQARVWKRNGWQKADGKWYANWVACVPIPSLPRCAQCIQRGRFIESIAA